jgi:hypothetical protein
MKRVIYRGGLVAFQIPATWREEYEPEGGGTFYEEGPNTGTLRLNVLSLQKAEPRSLEAATREIFRGSAVEKLPNGFPLRRYSKQAEEQGTPLVLYRWEVLVPVSPSKWRLVCFTHTILSAHVGLDQSKAELDLIDKLVREADYSTQPGVTPQKRRWKFW